MEAGESIDNFIRLLEQLHVSDNTLRSNAENTFNTLKEQNNTSLPFMLLTALSHPHVSNTVQRLAVVLLRLVLIRETPSLFFRLDPGRREDLKGLLLLQLNTENDIYLKSRLCDIVGELSGILHSEDIEWPEILTFTQGCVVSNDPVMREIGLGLISMISDQILAVLDNGNQLVSFLQIFTTCFSDSSNGGRVLISVIRALHSVLYSLPEISDIDRFSSLTGPSIQGFRLTMEGFQSNHWSEAVPLTYLETVVDIVEVAESFFSGSNLDNAFNSTFQIFASPQTPSNVKNLILELFVTFCNKLKKKVRKMKGPTNQKYYFIKCVYPVCVEMMCRIDDDPNWDKSLDAEESVESVTDCDIGESALDRMCKDLGLTATWEICSKYFNELLNSNSWQCNVAGLKFLANYMEVSSKISNKQQLAEHIINVGKTVLPFISHSNPRVKAAAFYCLNHLFLMHRSNIKEDQVVFTLRIVLQNLSVDVNPSPRVRRFVLQCLSTIIDSTNSLILEEYTGDILNAVIGALQAGPIIVQELCISCVMSVAETIPPAKICIYYDSLMPILKQLLAYAYRQGLEELWGDCIICSSMIGEAAGKEKFYTDALELMNQMMVIQQQTSPDSNLKTYFVKTLVRIGRCLREDFMPYLPVLTTQLLSMITQDVYANNIDPEEIENRSDVHMVEMEDGWKVVRTAAVEEQSTACQQLLLLVERLQENFFDHVEASVKAVSALLDSPHEDVRSFCSACLPELVRATAKATAPSRDVLLSVNEFVIGKLLRFIETENTVDLIMTGIQSLRQVFVYAATNWESLWPYTVAEPPKPVPATSLPFLNEEQMKAICDTGKIILRDSCQRRAVLRAEAQVTGVVDDDDLADERMNLYDSLELYYNISELLGTVFRTHGSRFYDVYRSMWHETVMTMAHPNCLVEDRQFAFFVISDILEFGLSESTNDEFICNVFPVLIDACMGVPNSGIRQTCAYCLGITATNFPNAFRPYALNALQALAACVQMGEDDGELRGYATDNAVNSVGLILEAMIAEGVVFVDDNLHASFPIIWTQWLAYLPLRHDTDEGKKVLVQLCRLLKNHNQAIFSSEENFWKAVRVLLDVLETDLSTPEVTTEITQTLLLLKINLNLFQNGNYASMLGAENATKLQKYLNMDVSAPLLSSSPQAPVPIHEVLMRT